MFANFACEVKADGKAAIEKLRKLHETADSMLQRDLYTAMGSARPKDLKLEFLNWYVAGAKF